MTSPLRPVAYALLVLLLSDGSRAHHLMHERPGDFSWAKNRLFSLSQDGPMAAYFSANETDGQVIKDAVAHFRQQEARILQLQRATSYSAGRPPALCNRISKKVLDAVYNKFFLLGLGNFTSSCITSVDVPFSEALFEKFSRFGHAMQRAGTAAIKATGIGWQDAYQGASFRYSDSIFRCHIVRVVGFRVRGRWAAATGITNFNTEFLRPDRGRRYISEYVIPDAPFSNILVTIPTCHPRNSTRNATRKGKHRVCDTTYETEREKVRKTTTIMEEWGGKPATSIFRAIAPLERNPAARAALMRGHHWRQQAEDVTTGSSIAIMVLSATLSLVPIAAFADVTWTITLAYALFTDLFACMPLFIKGIELIDLSSRTQTAAVSWVYGMENDTDLAVIESWAAKCNATNQLRVTGGLFVVAALGAMAIGTVLELFMRKRLHRKKEKYRRIEYETYEETLRQAWAEGEDCRDCDCRRRERRDLFPDHIMPRGHEVY